MTDFAKEIVPVNLEDEMKQSYLDYAMSVIIGRALPDAETGASPRPVCDERAEQRLEQAL
jgi:DNA gyrase subunit A